MARLVLLSEGYTGRTYELKVEKTTVGRVEDNAFQIPDASVSSHHAEIILKGSDVLVRDLNSTNGSFINGEPITEAVVKPGQILRLGHIDMRLEIGTAEPPSGKKVQDRTQVISKGVKLDELTENKGGAFKPDTSPFFKKKSNKARNVFIIIGVVLGIVIVGALVMAFVAK
ncbi:MAG: FHA domain-containing protein [Verrucomicrobiota bacterium]